MKFVENLTTFVLCPCLVIVFCHIGHGGMQADECFINCV